MSRVFKRPMFRKGGGANMNGIMSNIQDRENYEDGTQLTPRQRYEQIVNQYSSPAVDPLGRYLIEGSLKGFGETGGTTLQNLSKAFGGETLQRFFDTQDRQRMSERDMKLAGLEMDIDEENRLRRLKEAKEATLQQQKFQEKLLGKRLDADREGLQMRLDADAANLRSKIKSDFDLQTLKNLNNKAFAAQTKEEKFKVYSNLYNSSTIPQIKNQAADLASYRVRADKSGLPYFDLDYNYSNKSKKFEPDFRSIPRGAVTFDAGSGRAFQKNSDGTMTELNPLTFKPLSQEPDGTE